MAVPSGIEIDADSRGLDAGAGQSIVEWEAVAGATSYEVEYRKRRIIVTTVHEEVKINEVNNTTFTISDLRDETHYPIRIRAKNSSSTSDWSDTIYTYPTKTTAGPNSIVRTIEILGYLDLVSVGTPSYDPPIGEFAFVLCGNTLPPDEIATRDKNEREITASQIRAGVAIWSTATGAIVTYKHDEKDDTIDCNSQPEFKLYSERVDSINKIQLSSPGKLMMDCQVPLDLVQQNININGCARSDDFNPITKTQIYLNISLEVREQQGIADNQCSKMFQIAMHEAGHVYGLDHSTTGYTTMRRYYLNRDDICVPTVSDVIAIAKVYQSR